jgi:hypothetical protein
MKWLLLLFLMNPDGSIEESKVIPKAMTQEECEAKGKAATIYYRKSGLDVKHLCVTGI